MTEHQLNRLKKHLDSSAESTPSNLDNDILKAAQLKLEQNTENKQTHSWLNRLIKSSFAQAGLVSVALTMLFFVSFALLVKPNSSPNIKSESYVIEFEHGKKAPQTAIKNTSEYIVDELEMPETQQGRDQLLAQVALPDVDALLAEMGFDEDQGHEKSLINIAMSDIRFMLDNDRFDNARLRYAQLKQRCEDCPLPDTLEALLINSFQGSG